jgi:ubiquinone/menaquinone biosynthesis C-methylase UbiE
MAHMVFCTKYKQEMEGLDEPPFDFAALLPRIGDWVAGVRGPYRYLHDSASQFPDQEALAASMKAAGLTDVRYRNFMGGVAALHIGNKPVDSRR